MVRDDGVTALEDSPDEMARQVPGAFVTDNKGLYDEMPHTVITPNGKERHIDIECLALHEGFAASASKLFLKSATSEQSDSRQRT